MGFFGNKKKNEVTHLSEKEKDEINHIVSKVNKLLNNFSSANEENLILKFENLVNELVSKRNHYLTEVSGLVFVMYASLLSRDVFARAFHHQAYEDSADRLKKVQNLLQSAKEHLDHSKHFSENKDLHDEIYSEIYMLLAYNNICFRRFYQAKRFAINALRFNKNNEIAKGIKLIVRDNIAAENEITALLKKHKDNPEKLKEVLESSKMHELTSKLALTFIDDNDKDTIKNTKKLNESLQSEKFWQSLNIKASLLSVLGIISNRLNPKNWTMVSCIDDKIKESFRHWMPPIINSLCALTLTAGIITTDINSNNGDISIGQNSAVAAQAGTALAGGLSPADQVMMDYSSELSKITDSKTRTAFIEMHAKLKNGKMASLEDAKAAGYDELIRADIIHVYPTLPGDKDGYDVVLKNNTLRGYISLTYLGGKDGVLTDFKIYTRETVKKGYLMYFDGNGDSVVDAISTKGADPLQLDFSSPKIIDSLAKYMERLNGDKEFGTSIEVGKKFYQIGGKSSVYFLNELGYSFSGLNKWSSADKVFQVGYKVDNNYTDLLINYAVSRFKLKDLKSASILASRYKKLGGPNSQLASDIIEKYKKES